MTSAKYDGEGKAPFKDYVIAVLDMPEDVQDAMEALTARGFAADDILLSAPVRSGMPESEREQGTLADPPTQAESLLTEEGFDQEQYALERRRGHAVIQVRTPHMEDVDRAHAILAAHEAHAIKRVGTWTRENLPSE